MLMLRSNKKARKVLYSLIGVPANLSKPRKSKIDQKIDDRIKSEYRAKLK